DRSLVAVEREEFLPRLGVPDTNGIGVSGPAGYDRAATPTNDPPAVTADGHMIHGGRMALQGHQQPPVRSVPDHQVILDTADQPRSVRGERDRTDISVRLSGGEEFLLR